MIRQLIYAFAAFLLVGHAVENADAAVKATGAVTQADELEQRLDRLEQDLGDTRDERDFEKIRADLLEAQTSWFEILISVLMGGFGLLVSGVVIYFTFRFGKAAVAEAKSAIEQERKEIQQLLDDAREGVGNIRTHASEAAELTKTLKDFTPANLPQDQTMKEAIRDFAAAAELKPRAQRSIDEYKALINAAALNENWNLVVSRAADMTDHFGKQDASVAAFALLANGVAMGNLEQHGDALAAYEEVLTRYGNSSELAVQETVAKAQFNKGMAYGHLEQFEQELSSYEEVLCMFGASENPRLLRSVAKALVNICHLRIQAKDFEKALETCEEIIRKFDEKSLAPLPEFVAKGLINKGVVLGKLGNPGDQLRACDEVINRYGASTDLIMKEMVHKAIFNRACVHGRTLAVEECVAALAKLRDLTGALDCEKIAGDIDFDPVRNDPKFVSFLVEHGCIAPAPKPARRKRKPPLATPPITP